MSTNRLRIGILGASGYTGAELVRLLSQHPRVEIALMTADRRAGANYDEVFPHLGGLELPGLIGLDDVEMGREQQGWQLSCPSEPRDHVAPSRRTLQDRRLEARRAGLLGEQLSGGQLVAGGVGCIHADQLLAKPKRVLSQVPVMRGHGS